MTRFEKLDETSADPAALPLIAISRAAFGRLPGLHAVMARAPALLEGYQELHRLFARHTSFDAAEKTVIWQAINVYHRCHYCVPAHTGIAKMMKVDDAVTEALREETPLPDPKLEALRDFTLVMTESRGLPTEAQLAAFHAAGYDERHALEIILAISQKVMSNYTNHLAQTPLDPPVQQFAWVPKDAR